MPLPPHWDDVMKGEYPLCGLTSWKGGYPSLGWHHGRGIPPQWADIMGWCLGANVMGWSLGVAVMIGCLGTDDMGGGLGADMGGGLGTDVMGWSLGADAMGGC